MCSFRAFWLLLAFLCVDVAIAQSRVNVYVADPRGGRGDVAANFLMARRLKELRPDADIRILVPRQSLDISKFLEPSLQNEAGFTEDGVKVIFYAPGTAVPPADVVVSYSVSGDPVSENIADSAPFVLMFLEPEVAARDPIRGAGWNSKEEPTLVKTVFFETGVGNAGLYVSPFARPAESFDQLQDRLSRETNMNPRSLPDLSRGFLAFGYSSSSDINRAYIEQILEIAKNAYKRRDDQPLLFILNQKGWADQDYHISHLAEEPDRIVEIGREVYLLPYSRLSLKLSEQLYGASTLPPLTTGDASFAMALQYDQPSIYELQGWKMGSHTDFMESMGLAKGSSNLSLHRQALRILENDDYQRASRNKPHGGLTVLVDRNLELFQQGYWDKMKMAAGMVRERASLAKNSWAFIDRLARLDSPKNSREHRIMIDRLDTFQVRHCRSALSQLLQRRNYP